LKKKASILLQRERQLQEETTFEVEFLDERGLPIRFVAPMAGLSRK